ncbi:head-tail connector protein [Streptosporangium sandarakinum]
MTYAYGAAVRLTQEVRSSGDLVTPAGISLTILLPDGTTDGPLTPGSTGVGVYHYDYATAQAGRHVARWVTEGPVGVAEEPFDVAAQWGGAGIVSLGEAKAHLNITSSADDAELAEMIRAVTGPIERYAGVVLRRDLIEEHPGGYSLVLHQTPVLALASIVGAAPGVGDVSVGDLQFEGSSGVLRRTDRAWISGPVRVAYTAGRTDVPARVRLAALMILQHLWETQRGGAVPRFGAEEAAWDPRFGYAVPRRALELLGEQVSGIA